MFDSVYEIQGDSQLFGVSENDFSLKDEFVEEYLDSEYKSFFTYLLAEKIGMDENATTTVILPDEKVVTLALSYPNDGFEMVPCIGYLPFYPWDEGYEEEKDITKEDVMAAIKKILSPYVNEVEKL